MEEEKEEMKTKVVFCTKVKRADTLRKHGHLRRLRSKNYRLDEFLHIPSSIIIENKKYSIERLMFSADTRSVTQEIWVVPIEN